MVLTSVNTDYNNDINEWPEIEHQIKCLADAGFTHTSWMHDWEGEYMYSKAEMLHARDLLNYYGIKSHTNHATEGGDRSKVIGGVKQPYIRERCTSIRKDYTNPDKYIREAGVDLLKNRIDFCATIGAYAMILHMQLPFGMFRRSKDDMEDYYKQVYKSFDEVENYAKCAGVKIALENLLFTPKEFQIDKFERMFDRYDADFVGLCFDSGHASVMFQDNYYELLEKYNDRLIATHLQDTDSIDPALLDDDLAVVRADSHRIPFTGVNDWDRLADFVAKAPIELPADFEVCLSYGKKYEDINEEMKALKEAHDAAVKFQGMVEERKAKL